MSAGTLCRAWATPVTGSLEFERTSDPLRNSAGTMRTSENLLMVADSEHDANTHNGARNLTHFEKALEI